MKITQHRTLVSHPLGRRVFSHTGFCLTCCNALRHSVSVVVEDTKKTDFKFADLALNIMLRLKVSRGYSLRDVGL